MIVVGLLSSEEEAEEIRFIAKVCVIKERVIALSSIDRMWTIAKEIGG